MDDHNECRLYMSFETPNPYLCSTEPVENNECVIEPIGEDAAYIDIDYEYQSPQDFDNSAYYDREFELSYKSNRFEELLRLPREELISGLQVLESKLKELNDDLNLVKVNPSPILEKLQAELLELQEKHNELKETNTKLSALVKQNESNTSEEAQETSVDEAVKPWSGVFPVDEEEMVVSSSDDKIPERATEIESRLKGTLCISENGHDQKSLDVDKISVHELKSKSPSSCQPDSCDEVPHSILSDVNMSV